MINEQLFTSIIIVSIIAASSITSRCFYLPNIALNGGTYDEINATDIKKCCIACAKDNCCIGYSYSRALHRCFMKSTLSDSEVSYTTTSGLKANINSGQAAFLRNIKIQGGTAVNIRLPNAEECQQYCTAYGMYSWSPPDYQDENTDGYCACMIRIQSLEYSFGSQSAIFPSVSLN